jgi:beta-lactamase superfamily II metal-dependent hydrolase
MRGDFMRAKIALLVLALTASVAVVSAQTRGPRTTLDIYVVDVEGGNSVLFITPAGESVLIDTGNTPPGAARDASRIMDAAKDAGITQIDHLIITHWHGDHFGGLTELAKLIPIKEYIDHGPNMQPSPQVDDFLQKTYPALYADSAHRVVKPGDKIQLTDVNWLIVTSAGEVIKTPVPGAGKPNPYCSQYRPYDHNAEDPQSVGSYITFGKFRAIHLGDDTMNKEFELMCPNNPIGTVDLLLGLHHGVASSNSPVAIHALQPRVAIMNNGTRKGGDPVTMQTIYTSPGLEDLWEIHFSLLSGQEYSAPGMFIANTTDDPQAGMPIAPMTVPATGAPPPPQHNGKAYWIKVSAQKDGTFTVTNARNGFSKTYESQK